VSIDQARAELETIHDRVQRTVQDASGRVRSSSVVVMPLHEKLIGPSRFPLQVLLAAALCVLLITCVNVGNLLLSRASARQREIALRMSVGGGPLRVIRLLLAESVAYSVVGGVAGLFFAWALIDIIIGLLGGAVPRLTETTLDVRVVAFVAGLSLITAIVFGLGPALALSRTSVHDVLKSGVRSASSSPRMLLAGRLSVAVQLAMAIVLLAGAGLMAKSLWRMTTYPPGFAPDKVLTMRVDFTGAAYREDAARFVYVDALLARARALPGVRDAAVTTDGAATMVVLREGEPPPEDRESRAAAVSAVSPSFGPVLGMSLVRGRWLDDGKARSTMLINEALAQRDFPGIDPVGHRIQLPWVDNRGLGTIIGVVRNLKYARIDADAGPEVFTHYKGRRLFGVTLTLRIDGDPMAAAPTITKALAAIDPTQSLFAVKTVEQRLEESIASRRFNLLLLGMFALVALVLVALGIYGVVAYAVAERTHEVGVRMALGAEQRAVVGLMVRQVMTGVAAGIVVGLPAAMLATRLLEDLLYDVPPTDALTFAATTGLLTVVALIASVVPSLKAACIDPVVALRAE
jgi:putative ABC transport system permease protein